MVLAGTPANYLGSYNFNPNNYLAGQNLNSDVSGLQTASSGVNSAAAGLAQGQMANLLYGTNFQRQGLLGNLGGAGLGRSALFGGAGAGRLQQFDAGVGNQLVSIAGQENQTINQNNLATQGALANANMNALQQAMWAQAQQPSPFDILGLGVSGLQAAPGIGAGVGMLGRLFG